LIGAAALSAACGKKGPPLAPIVHVPGAVEQIEARRRGNDVTVTVTVPAKNIDGSIPVDVSRVEVYGYTGTDAPPRSRFLEVATLVGTVTIAPLKPDAPAVDATAKPGEPIPGGPATSVESLSPEALVAKPIPPAPTTGRELRPIVPVATVQPEPGPLRRFYLALPFSPRGRPGPPGVVAELRLTDLPDAPLAVKATYLADLVTVRVEWEPSGGLIGFLLDRALPPELSPLDNPPPAASAAPAAPPVSGPTRYNVYREIAELKSDVPAAAPAPSTTPSTPVAINPAPLDVLTFSDPLSGLDARERCYVVRSVRGIGPQEGVARCD
jgi:hypothetical protein